MKQKIFLTALIFSLLAHTACSTGGSKETSRADAKTYDLKGKVISVDRLKKKATIEHKEIPGYMDAMTMDFKVRADWVWEDLKPGSEIFATLVVDPSDPDGYWLENIAISALPGPGDPPTPLRPEDSLIGKKVVDFKLTDQDGRGISPQKFSGKAWALTFIYAQCPLPEFCIKMSRNFSDAAKLVMNLPEKSNYGLLSVSFDPARDTPKKLRDYGAGYLGNTSKPDFSVWSLAVGKDVEVRKVADFAGLRYEVDETDKTKFNHSLRTLVIAPDGTVSAILAGNDWVGSDLVTELKSAFNKKP